jgi:hypothetical protein
MVNQRWGWTPGRQIGRPVWAPALVGWVGGSGWSLSFNSRSAPAQGWYPLGFADQYVPGYRVKQDHLRYINRHARPHDGRKGRDDHRRHGLTVVPHDQFQRRAPIVVPSAPRAVVSPLSLQTAPVLAPQAPPAGRGDRTRRQRDDQRAPDAVSYRDRRPVQPQIQAPAPVPAQAEQLPAGLSSAQREWHEKRRAQAEDARRGELDQLRRAQMEEARRGQAEALRRTQAEEARRSQAEEARRSQAEDARRGQVDQMRRMQMEEMRRGQMDELRRARQGQQQAAPAAAAPQAAPQPSAAPAAAPAQSANPPVQQERRQREDSPRNRGNRHNENLE